MYKVNNLIVYKRDLCKIVEIKRNDFNNRDYYVLIPIADESLKIELPIDIKVDYIREVISKEKAFELIKKIPSIKTLKLDSKNLDIEYKNLYNSSSIEDLIIIIKTSYLRNDNRKKEGKKLSEKDSNFFNKAEKSLYTELSFALNMSYDETKNFIINEVKKNEKSI